MHIKIRKQKSKIYADVKIWDKKLVSILTSSHQQISKS